MSEFRTAQEQGEIAAEQKPLDPNLQQMSDGARQFASATKGFFTQRVAPAAAGAARNVQQSIGEQAGQARGGEGWKAWVPIALPVSALLGIISLFLPAATASASGMGFSFSKSQYFFDADAGGLGWWMLLFFLVVLVCGVFALAKRTRRIRITAGIVGIVIGTIGTFVSIAIMAGVNDVSTSGMGFSASASVGPGTVFLMIMSIIMIVAAILTLLSVRTPQTAVPTSPQAPWEQHPHNPQQP